MKAFLKIKLRKSRNLCNITDFFIGLKVEGIFRISAPKSRLDELETIVNSGKSFYLTDVHDATGLLKRFLRQLPEHILTEKMRDTFEQIASGETVD